MKIKVQVVQEIGVFKRREVNLSHLWILTTSTLRMMYLNNCTIWQKYPGKVFPEGHYCYGMGKIILPDLLYIFQQMVRWTFVITRYLTFINVSFTHARCYWKIILYFLMQSIIDLLDISVIHEYSRLHVFALKEYQKHYCEYMTSKTDLDIPEFSQLIRIANNYVSPSLIIQEYSSIILKCALSSRLIFKNSAGLRVLRFLSFLKSKFLSYYWAVIVLHQRGELVVTLLKKFV